VTPFAWAIGVIVLVLALAETRATGAFTAGTANGSNRVGTASDFCTVPGPVPVSAAADNSVSQSGADALPTANAERLRVISKYTAPSSLNHRTFVRFSLPSRPTGCTLTSATLRLFLDLPYAGRTLDAHLVDPTLPLWGEAGFRYSTQPAVVAGSAVGFAVGAGATVAQWTVTSSVQAQYGGTHNGFLIRDRNENDASGLNVENVIFSRDSPNSGATAGKQPVLQLVWG
jgi:hypothetical protein